MEEKTKNSQSIYDELLAITRSDAELRAQFVAVLEDLKREHGEIRIIINEFRIALGDQGREIRERLERMERIIDATYLHVSHLAESAITVLKSDRSALAELRSQIEQKVIDQIDRPGMTIEAGKDIHIQGNITEAGDEDKSRK